MRRYISYLLIIVSLVSYLNMICFADSPNTESIRQELNQDMEEVYGIRNYYPAEVGGRSLNIYTREEVIDGGHILTYIPAYGSPSGDEYRNIKEYIGYTPNGINDQVSNPAYGWREGWSGRRMYVWGQIEAPWGRGACVKSNFDDKTFNVPGKGITSLEDAMQVGVDLRYAGKKYEEIRFSERSMQHIDKIVHIKGEKPAGGWVKYVHVIIPPTRKAWGEGRMYLSSGNYMGIPIAPFDLISSDLSAHLSPGTFSPVENGDRVSLSATVKSNFEDSQETYYEWEIVGEKTGIQYHLQSNEGKTDEEKTKFGGYGEVDKSMGNVTVSQYINEHSPNPPAVFNLTFSMPEEAVKVRFTVNKNGDKPKESNVSNNTAEVTIPWQPFLRHSATLHLDYNELSKQIEYAVSGGQSITATVSTSHSWNGNATGSLGVNIQNSPTALNGAQVKDGTNDSVDEASSSVSRYPVIQGTLIRPDFGDDPDMKYLSNASNPVKRNMTINFSGSMSRPWIHRWRHDDSDGNSCYHTDTGTSTGSFQAGQDKVDIIAYVYNGRKDMPQVAARNFKKQVDNNTLTSLSKTMWWESESYVMSVQRWMKHVFIDEPDEWVAIDGQYNRTFTQQNKAEIKWQVQRSMAQEYHSDRQNAANRRKGKNYYSKAVFATDKELQRYTYPIKSGYYFNPTGTYTFTVETEIYKDTPDYTDEHEDLVDKIIESFKYDSNMTYTMGGRDTYKLELTADDELVVAEKSITRKVPREIPSSPNSGGNTHKFFKEILEGYAESKTEDTINNYLYREYIKEGKIYRVEEKTTITIKVNPDNKPIYTYPNMKDGSYQVKAWVEDFEFTDPYNRKYTVKGIKSASLLDTIGITVKGSMYDDLNN